MSDKTSGAVAGGPPPPGQASRKNEGRRGPPPPTDSIERVAGGAAVRPAQQGKKRKSSGILLSILVSVGFALAASKFLPFVLLLMIGLAPTWIAILSDPDPFRARVATLAQLNLAGALPFLSRLWQEGGQMKVFLAIMSDVFTWIAMFGSAGVAVALLWLGPQGMSVVRRTVNAARRLELEREQAQIAEEWGDALFAPIANTQASGQRQAWTD
jgi:hypothetical protein